MTEITQTVPVKAWHIGTTEDGFDEWPALVKWCSETDGMSCSMTARSDGGVLHIQVEGRNFGTVFPTPDSYVTFNTFAFEKLTNAEFAAKYG